MKHRVIVTVDYPDVVIPHDVKCAVEQILRGALKQAKSISVQIVQD